jgi:hypothetical protein
MSERAARSILPFPTACSQQRREDKLSAARRFRQRAEDTEDAIRERITTRQGHRLNEAIGAAEAAAPSAGEPPAMAGHYLIHVPNSSASDHLTQEIDLLAERMERAGRSKIRTNAMAAHLWASDPEVAAKLASCNTYRVFRHWLESGDARLIAAKCCKQDKLCPVCASLRSGRNASRYASKILALLSERPTLSEWFWTFTVVDGPDLSERLHHLRDALKLLIDHTRKHRNGVRGNSWMPFCVVAGGVYSVEVTIGKNSGLWHPHVHIFTLCDAEPPVIGTRCVEMEDWWQRRTGDSFIVDVRPVSGEQRASAVLETLKYTTKFSALTLEQNVHAWRVCTDPKRLRMMQPFGVLKGVPSVTNLTDELSDDEGAFVDLAFRHDGERYVRDYTGECVA